MPNFSYQARDSQGQRLSGSQEAPNRQAALEALREKGLFVTRLEPVGNSATQKTPKSTLPSSHHTSSASSTLSPIPKSYWLRANSKELALFFRQMHAMLHAGTSLGHALGTMAKNAPNTALRVACEEMNVYVTRGTPWSTLMASFPGVFSPLMTSMIRAGEEGGFLDQVCLRLAEYSERDYEMSQMIKRETWYPKLLLVLSLLIPTIVPAAQAYFLGTGNFWEIWLRAAAPPLLFLGAIALAIRFKNYLAPVFKHITSLVSLIDQIKLMIPIAGKTTRALATAKFCRALGTLQAAGTGIQRTIHLSADACGNAVIANSTRRTIHQIESGATLTDALESTRQFPAVAIQMLRTGEATGNLTEQLEKVADFLEDDAETTIKQTVVAMGILIFLLMAVYISILVITQYVGLYDGIIDQGIDLQN